MIPIAGSKLTLIKAHTPENAYDGYDPHRHWELVNLPAADYLSRVVGNGLVYPGTNMADYILSPWQLPWIRDNVKVVGYDFLEQVDPAHYHLYAFDSLHDGIDGQLVDGAPGAFVQRVQSRYTNAYGRHATAEIYEVEVDSVLQKWQTQQGYEALDYLSNVGMVSNPVTWKHSLDQPVQYWVFWSLMQRLHAAGKE